MTRTWCLRDTNSEGTSQGIGLHNRKATDSTFELSFSVLTPGLVTALTYRLENLSLHQQWFRKHSARPGMGQPLSYAFYVGLGSSL